ETVAGTLALDMAAATTLALHRAGVDIVDDLGFDTADERFFSHRVRGDVGRQITAARLVTA
ncbi:MAG TPA: polyphenol oxidase, partial [Acidimicrobiaceae bacterium]|nr:polyphenol oxidase [Acidimicrobiaceae bacterium]